MKRETKLPAFRVHRDDGTSYVTSMASWVTLKDARAYFLGAVQYLDDAETIKVKVVDVKEEN